MTPHCSSPEVDFHQLCSLFGALSFALRTWFQISSQENTLDGFMPEPLSRLS